MAIVGPGSVKQDQVAPKPLLEGVTEYEFVTVHNLLTDDFAVQVAMDIPINMPMEVRAKTAGVQDRTGLVMQYGQDFKNPDFIGRKHALNQTIIPAGGTMNFRGNEALVAVRQLVNEIMQREGKQKFLADPTARHEVEERIIKRRGFVQDLMDQGLQTTQQQTLSAIDKSNEVNHVESAFPGLVSQGDDSVSYASRAESVGTEPQPKRTPGRPRKNSDA